MQVDYEDDNMMWLKRNKSKYNRISFAGVKKKNKNRNEKFK